MGWVKKCLFQNRVLRGVRTWSLEGRGLHSSLAGRAGEGTRSLPEGLGGRAQRAAVSLGPLPPQSAAIRSYLGSQHHLQQDSWPRGLPRQRAICQSRPDAIIVIGEGA